MKLYTEEQVMEAYHIGTEDSNWGRYRENADALKLTPIELPSDEEIEKEIESDIHIESDADYFNGAKWVIEQIKQQ